VGEGVIEYVIGVRGVESIVRGGALPPETDSIPLREALSKDLNIDVDHIPSYYATFSFPAPDELMKYDVLILSDVGYYTIAQYESDVHGPDRVKGIKNFVKAGGGLLYCGGDMSYGGSGWKAKWWRTPVADVLPVEIIPYPGGDVLLTTEGFKIEILEPEHELIKDIPWDTCPRFFGYNMVGEPKKDANLLATIGYPGEEKDPCLVEWTYGKGRVLAFTSDPVPTWGEDFSKWKYYQKFWTNAIKWLTKKTVKKRGNA
jgi:uncharacterized membrane protein